MGPQSGDEHVTDLSDRVRAIIAREEGKPSGAGAGADGGAIGRVVSQESNEAAPRHEFRRVSSVDEQEETEKAV